MTGIMCALAGAGGSAISYTGTATVTVGTRYEPDPVFARYWGYRTGQFGSISPATWASSGLTVNGLYYLYYSDLDLWVITFGVSGSAPNSGWTTLSIAGTSYSRADASYSNSGTSTSWQWFPGSNFNPFGTTTGAAKAIVWS